MKNLNISLFWRTVIFTVTVTLNFFIFYAIASRLGSVAPIWMATLITGSMVIHECAHALIMSASGLKPLMFFAVIIGGAMPTKIDRLQRLSWSRQAAIALAGPFANLLLIGVGGALYLPGVISLHHFEQIASINTILFFLNLLPISILDGGRFAKLLFDSLPENVDIPYARTIGLGIIVLAMVLAATLGGSSFFTPWFIYLGLLHRATHDDPTGSRSRQAMKSAERIRWATYYVAMLVVGLALYNLVPNWME